MNQNVKQSGILPEKYEKCIESKSLAVQIRNKEFILCSLEQLFQHTVVNGESCLNIYRLRSLMKTLQEIDLFDSENKRLLENSLSIGAYDECILFVVDGDDASLLYLFHTDGGYIEDLDISLDVLMSQMEGAAVE